MYIYEFHMNIPDENKELDVDPIRWPFTANLKETGMLAKSLPSIVSRTSSSLGRKSFSSEKGPVSAG